MLIERNEKSKESDPKRLPRKRKKKLKKEHLEKITLAFKVAMNPGTLSTVE